MCKLFGLRSSRVLSAFAMFFVLACLAGCESAIIKSTNIIDSAQRGKGKAYSGLVYSPPHGQVRLTAERKKLKDEDVKEAIAAIAQALEAEAALQKESSNLTEKAKKAADDLGDLPTDTVDPVNKIYIENKNKATAAAAIAKTQAARATDEVDRAFVAYLNKTCINLTSADISASDLSKIIEAAKSKPSEISNILKHLDCVAAEYEETVMLERLPVVADPNELYIAELNHSIFRDDSTKFTVENGLLMSGTFTTTDQTPAIILKLAQNIGAFAPSSPNIVMSYQPDDGSPRALATPLSCAEYKISYVFDPASGSIASDKFRSVDWGKVKLNPDEWAKAPAADGEMPVVDRQSDLFSINQIFFQNESSFLLAVEKPTGIRSHDDPKVDQQRPIANPRPNQIASNVPEVVDEGFVYRVLRPFKIHLRSHAACNKQKALSPQMTVVNIPDPDLKLILPMMAGAFTKNVVTANFKEGMPVDYAIDRPSELNAVVGLPLDVAKALISVPAEMIQLKVNYSSKDTAFVAAQQNALDAKTALIEAQQKYDAAVRAAAVGE